METLLMGIAAKKQGGIMTYTTHLGGNLFIKQYITETNLKASFRV